MNENPYKVLYRKLFCDSLTPEEAKDLQQRLKAPQTIRPPDNGGKIPDEPMLIHPILCVLIIIGACIAASLPT